MYGCISRSIQSLPSEIGFGLLESEESICRDILINEVVSRLTFEEFQRIGRVNKTLRVLSNSPALLKKKIFYEKTFNPSDWDYYFKLKVPDQILAWETLPDHIGQIFKSKCPIFSDKKLGETHVIVWIPKDMSINKYGNLLKKKFPNNSDGYHSIFNQISDQYGSKLTDFPDWVIMPRKILPESGRKKTTFQKKMIAKIHMEGLKNYTFPKLLEVIICSSTSFFKFNIGILKNKYTKCQECLDVYQDGKTYRLIAGFSPSDLILDHDHSNDEKIGVAPACKFLEMQLDDYLTK